MKLHLLIFLLLLPGWVGAAVYVTDGTPANIQSNINVAIAAGTSNTVFLPPGFFSSTTTINISNANNVFLQGSGSGKVIDEFTNNLTVATGALVATVHSGLPISNGQTLTIERLGGAVVGFVPTKPIPSMVGTVSSYSGTTLTMNISTINGSGTHPVWIISTQPTTVITNLVASGDLISVNEPASGYTQISGIRFTGGAGGNTSGSHINIHRVTSGNPLLIHDNYFYLDQSVSGINCNDNKGVIWSNSAVAAPFSQARLFFHVQSGPTTSWNTLSTLGTNDLTGTSNGYIEDNDFHAFLNWSDLDDNARWVIRYNLFNNSGEVTHGADTSNYGVRHYEIYCNRGLYNAFNTGQTLNLNWWFFLRGGTGIFFSNDLPILNSTDFGNHSSWSFAVLNLQEPGGPHGCWGQGTSGGADYPAPRQVGFGNTTGNSTPADAFAYLGNTEPLYCWSNSNTGGASFGWRNGGGGCVAPDNSANYIVQNRDFFTNTVAPNYAPYTYPHPLRAGILPPVVVGNIARVTNLHVGNTHVGP